MPNATAARLRISLERIVEETLELTRGIGVRRLDRDLGTAVIVTGADFYFDKLSAPQQAAQLKVKRRYEAFSEKSARAVRMADHTRPARGCGGTARRAEWSQDADSDDHALELGAESGSA